jgi:hypothetical protein
MEGLQQARKKQLPLHRTHVERAVQGAAIELGEATSETNTNVTGWWVVHVRIPHVLPWCW